MEQAEVQARIDAVSWYHEFDFGNGLKARSQTPDVENHRALWRFIEAQLTRVAFQGKTVLDVGCWDGYWSFYAERQGAKSVLATDDVSQNWGGDTGLLLAKELLGSAIEVNTSLSVYELGSLGRRFDIILCLGVYYHLLDPFYAFAQIRHCCHPETVILFEGDATLGLRPNTLLYDLSDHAKPIFVPTPQTLTHMLKGAYFDVASQTWPEVPLSPSWRRRLRIYTEAVGKAPSSLPGRMGRLFTVCRPFQGRNEFHAYRPPFGLDAYDDRWVSGPRAGRGVWVPQERSPEVT